MEWTVSNVDPNDVLAHPDPPPLTFFTRRPAALLPSRLDTDGLTRFIANYHVSYVPLSREDTTPAYRKDYADYLGAPSAEEVRSTTLGSYRIFDTRSLWR